MRTISSPKDSNEISLTPHFNRFFVKTNRTQMDAMLELGNRVWRLLTNFLRKIPNEATFASWFYMSSWDLHLQFLAKTLHCVRSVLPLASWFLLVSVVNGFPEVKFHLQMDEDKNRMPRASPQVDRIRRSVAHFTADCMVVWITLLLISYLLFLLLLFLLCFCFGNVV